LKMWIFF